MNLYRSTVGASERCLHCKLEITRDITYLVPLNRLINVLESGDIWGLRPSTVQTNPVWISMMRWCSWSRACETKPSREALRNPLKWSKELINEFNETKIQGPLGLSSGICVLSLTEGDLPLFKELVFPWPEARGRWPKDVRQYEDWPTEWGGEGRSWIREEGV